MLHLEKINKYPPCNISNDCQPSVVVKRNMDKEFTHDLKIILRASRSIKNQTVRQRILEFYLSALVAKYVENKINCLIETDLLKTLNFMFHYGGESKKPKS